jgi:LPXTG-motif cell wall-anchored protein
MDKLMKYPVKFGVAALGLVGLLTVLVTNLFSSASAAATCTAADFTTNGVFDTDGYLACLAGQGGDLPATGSNTAQIVAIALGLVALGVAAVMVAKKRRATFA